MTTTHPPEHNAPGPRDDVIRPTVRDGVVPGRTDVGGDPDARVRVVCTHVTREPASDQLVLHGNGFGNQITRIHVRVVNGPELTVRRASNESVVVVAPPSLAQRFLVRVNGVGEATCSTRPPNQP